MPCFVAEKKQILIERLWLRRHLLVEPIHTGTSTTKCLALFSGFSFLYGLSSHPLHQILFHRAGKPWNSPFQRLNQIFTDT